MKARVEMGADRLKDRKDQAKRGWDKAGQRLTQPIQLSLFDADPIFGRRSFRIALRNNVKAGLGDQLLLQTANDNRFVTRGVEIIGDCPNLPAAVLDTLKVGGAICLEVISVGAISNTLEVAPK
ncbi:MAG: hypothetical protein QOD09_419 [Bradyrhizobium sp.]|jgi:hypothetical protein|nr:hypothetical protein [Bradyrhizobium sp.]